ncbi:MAG: hypothetical protein IJ986_03770 [Bacteroidales bacterium]|nr:hypothetical protein [Bacteroidales bacterium]
MAEEGWDGPRMAQMDAKTAQLPFRHLPHYETLHTESRENLAKGLVECLNNWEAKK